MNEIVELSATLIQIFLLTWFISNFFGYKYTGARAKIGFLCCYAVVIAETMFINKIVVYDSFYAGIVVATLFLYARLCLDGKALFQIFISLFSMAIIFCVGSVTIFFISAVSAVGSEQLISDFSGWRIAVIAISKLAEFGAFWAIIHIKNDYSLSNKEWILFISMPFFTWISVTLLTKATIASPGIIRYALFTALMVASTNIIIYYFMLQINQDTKAKTELAFLRMQYENVKNNADSMRTLYENTYSLKHDLKEHFLAIETMAKKNMTDEIVDYAERVIQKPFDSVRNTVFTDNDIFNAVINTKLEICRQKGIVPVINVSNAAIGYIRAEDIAVVFGNLLDNAIEAAEKTESKFVALNVMLQGSYVAINVENSFDPKFSDSGLKTTKSNETEHGFGIKNVKKVVAEYDGMIDFCSEKDLFLCDVLLKICG